MPRKVTEPSFQFWFAEQWYTVQGAETMARIGTKDDYSTMKSEYTRMRDVAQKRLKRLQKAFPESKAVQNHPSGFPKIKDLDPRDFPKAFAELAKFVKAKGSTVTGQRQIKEKTMKTWQDQGLNLNEKNYDKTIKVLEEMRKQKIVYGSDKAVELADSIIDLDDQQMNDLFAHLDDVMAHQQEFEMLKDIYESRGETVDIEQLIKEIGW